MFCYGVIQHTPDEEAILQPVSMVKPGGEIAVDVYDAEMDFPFALSVRWFTKHMDQEKLWFGAAALCRPT